MVKIDTHGKIKIFIGILVIIIAVVLIVLYLVNANSFRGNEIANSIFIVVGVLSFYVILLSVYNEFYTDKDSNTKIQIIHSIPNAEVKYSKNMLTIKAPSNVELIQKVEKPESNLIFD